MGGLLRSLIFPLLAAVIAGLHYATVLLGCAAKLAQPAYDFFLAGLVQAVIPAHTRAALFAIWLSAKSNDTKGLAWTRRQLYRLKPHTLRGWLALFSLGAVCGACVSWILSCAFCVLGLTAIAVQVLGILAGFAALAASGLACLSGLVLALTAAGLLLGYAWIECSILIFKYLLGKLVTRPLSAGTELVGATKQKSNATKSDSSPADQASATKQGVTQPFGTTKPIPAALSTTNACAVLANQSTCGTNAHDTTAKPTKPAQPTPSTASTVPNHNSATPSTATTVPNIKSATTSTASTVPETKFATTTHDHALTHVPTLNHINTRSPATRRAGKSKRMPRFLSDTGEEDAAAQAARWRAALERLIEADLQRDSKSCYWQKVLANCSDWDTRAAAGTQFGGAGVLLRV